MSLHVCLFLLQLVLSMLMCLSILACVFLLILVCFCVLVELNWVPCLLIGVHLNDVNLQML